MLKADLLDELRSQIGVMADRCDDDIEQIFPSVCDVLVNQVDAYQSVLIYLVDSFYFKKCYYSGKNNMLDRYRFGDGKLSIAAVRGNLVCEKRAAQMEVYVPFYSGHHLKGIFIVLGRKSASLDDEDLSFFCEVASLFESRLSKK